MITNTSMFSLFCEKHALDEVDYIEVGPSMSMKLEQAEEISIGKCMWNFQSAKSFSNITELLVEKEVKF